MPISLPHIVIKNHMHEDVTAEKSGFISPEDYLKLLDSISSSLLGAPNGVATLGADGLLTASQRAGGTGEEGPTTASQVVLSDFYDEYDALNVEEALHEISNNFSRNGHIHTWDEVVGKPTTFTPSYHVHQISEIANLQNELDGLALRRHTHLITDIVDLDSELAMKASWIHKHEISDINWLQSALDSKSPAGHTHSISDIPLLTTQLAQKADLYHSHTISDVDGLQDALINKAAYIHNHEMSTLTNFQYYMDKKSDISHTHQLDAITGLRNELNTMNTAISGKSSTTHTHNYSAITGLTDQLDLKASKTEMASADTSILNQSKSYTDTKVSALVDAAPGTLDTLNELAQALGDDPNFATTVSAQIATKANNSDLTAHTGNTTVHISASERLLWNSKASGSHTHAISEITGLQSILDGKATTSLATTLANGLMSSTDKGKLDGIAPNANNYVHPSGDGNLHVPATSTTNNGKFLKAGGTAGALSWAIIDYTDIGNRPATMTPSAHVHAISEITGLQDALDGKAASSHIHSIANVTNLQTTLDGKSAVGHVHAIADVTNLQTALNGKANAAHTHAIADVTGLQGTLDSKAATLHTHVISDVTNLQTSLDGKAPASHSHVVADVTGLQALLDGKASTAVVTTTTDGIMLASDKVKLNGIATNANNYAHPTSDGNLHVPATSTTNGGKILKAGSTAGSFSWSTFAYSELTGVPTTFAPSAHVHAIADITNLQSTLDGKASTALVTTSTSGLMASTDKTKLDGIATGANNYVHPTGDGSLHVPATSTTNNGKVLKAGATAGALAWGTLAYTDLTNIPTTFTPSAHTHAIADVTNLQSTLDGKAAVSHTHTIANVTNLQTTLDGKAASSHTHAIADVTGLQAALDAKVSEGSRNMANGFAGLNASGKIDPAQLPEAGTTTVDWINVQNKPSTFTPSTHTHAISDITDLQTTLDGKASTAVVTTTTNGLMIAADKVKLNGIATGANNYAHPTGDGNLHVPATSTTNNGKVLKAGATAGSLAWGTLAYADLTGVPTSFNPSAHTHTIADVTNLQSTLDGKASASHGHAISEVTNLQTTLDGKASTAVATTTTDGLMASTDKTKLNGIATGANNYVHPTGDGSLHVPATSTSNNGKVLKAGATAGSIAWSAIAYSELTGIPTTFAPSAHTHAITDITNLQTTLNGKAAVSHTHAIADVTGLQTALDGKVSATDAQGYATTAETNAKSYTDTKVSALVDAAPGTLDTLNELAQALGDDPNFATTVSNQIAAKADASVLSSHTGDTVIHVSQADRDGWNAKANGTHTHTIADITNLQTTLNGKASTAAVTTSANGLMIASDKSKLDGIASGANNYVHPTSDGNLHVPATSTTNNGKVLKAGATAGSLAWSTIAYTELTGVPSTFSPSAHTHAISDITNLQSSLDAKADSSHVHAIADITSLQTTLDGKASTAVVTTSANGLMIAADKVKLNGIATGANAYTHPSGDGNLHVPATSTTNSGKFLGAGATAGSIAWDFVNWSEVAGKPTTFAPSSHTHAIADVTDLQTTLDGKAAASHTHSIADITSLQATLDGKASTAVVTTSANGLMIASDKVKLNGISTGANKVVNTANNGEISIDGVAAMVYSHPSTHPATMITEDSTHRFATDAEKGNWNSKETTSGAQAKADAALNASKAYAVNMASTGSTADPNTTLEAYILTNSSNSPGQGLHWHIDTRFYSSVSASSNRSQFAQAYNSTTPRFFVRNYYSSYGWTTWRELSGNEAATASVAGLMSAADKSKLDGIAAGANTYTHPTGDGNLHVPATGTSNSGKFLGAGSTAGSIAWDFVNWTEVAGKPTTFAPSAHTHAISEITSLQATLDSKAAASHTHAIGDVTNLQSTLDGKAASSHTHAIADITSLQTTLDGKASTAVVTTTANGLMIASDKVKLNGIATSANNYVHPTGDGSSHVPATGTTNNTKVLKAGSTANSAAWGAVSYTELTNVPTSFVPSAHTHAIANITNLQFALDDKANLTHSHAIGDVTDLQATLDGKAPTSHTHTIAQVTNLQTTLDGKAPTSHTHTIAQIANLQTTLDQKAYFSHTHQIHEIDLLWNVLNEKVPKTGGILENPTIMGKMKFDSNVYIAAGGVLDLSNSDIIGMNGLYFNDVSDATEGIGWARTGVPAGTLDGSQYDLMKVRDGAGFINSTPIFTAKENGDYLWRGVLMMQSGESVTPSKKLSQCPGGWILAWSDLNPPSTSQDAQWVYTVVPKYAAIAPGSQYFAIPTNHTSSATSYTIKTLSITDTTIGGGGNNSTSGSLSDDVCLRAVVEF